MTHGNMTRGMLDFVYPFALKKKFDLFNVLRQELGDLRQDARFLAALGRALAPGLTRRGEPMPTTLFPPLEPCPHPVLAGKRVGLVASGGSAAQVTMCGVKRALEEACIDVAAISVCSGSAIWGSMIAAGLDAQQMVELSASWTVRDMVDIDLRELKKLLFDAGRGFTGLSRGEAIERTLTRAYGGMTLAQTKIPCYSIIYNVDTNDVEYLGPHHRSDTTLAKTVRTAIALPLFVQPVQFGEHLYLDGGTVNVFPVEPLLQFEAPFDYILGINVIMPPGFGGEDITGWADKPMSVVRASRQLYHCQWLELARQQIKKAGPNFLMLEPLPYETITGTRFFELFLDHSRWADHIVTAYQYTKAKLQELADSSPVRRVQSA